MSMGSDSIDPERALTITDCGSDQPNLTPSIPSILIAGVGNVLHGDDGFGVELATRLAKRSWPAGVKVIETGIGGMTLVQELMLGYDALLLLDAHASGGLPGTVRLLEPSLPDLSALDPHALRDYFADTHF